MAPIIVLLHFADLYMDELSDDDKDEKLEYIQCSSDTNSVSVADGLNNKQTCRFISGYFSKIEWKNKNLPKWISKPNVELHEHTCKMNALPEGQNLSVARNIICEEKKIFNAKLENLIEEFESHSLGEEMENSDCLKLDDLSLTCDNSFSSKGIRIVQYLNETQLPSIMEMVSNDLSEPYTIYTFRYFLHTWPHLCFLAHCEECKQDIGVIICKMANHYRLQKCGYIAMLAVKAEHRRKGIGRNLVIKAIREMVRNNCGEVMLETEVTNSPALALYHSLGFYRSKRLLRYYMNGVDAFRLKLPFHH
ncbi:N-alpha-acetyltransferase 30 [Trichinella spiralis]|uniref:N-alpha-acetyltransferase 30 n=1 Tax=Trichinella spiralis TaxID=6334 RepID=A0A0V1BX70_TRISP|nr:N-alpha-acetyltransferase 30 [Trichinella spiralis]